MPGGNEGLERKMGGFLLFSYHQAKNPTLRTTSLLQALRETRKNSQIFDQNVHFCHSWQLLSLIKASRTRFGKKIQ